VRLGNQPRENGAGDLVTATVLSSAERPAEGTTAIACQLEYRVQSSRAAWPTCTR
jgi:hypothetical protein